MSGPSTKLEFRLECDGRVVKLAQVASGWVVAECPVALPACRGTVVVDVDGKAIRRSVFLPEGMTLEANCKTPIRGA